MEGADKLELKVLAGQLMAIKEGLGMYPIHLLPTQGLLPSAKPVVTQLRCTQSTTK